MWPELIGSIATGLTGIVVAVAGLLTARSRSTTTDLSDCREEKERQRSQLVTCLRHMYRLEKMLANSGVAVPDRPQALRDLVS